MREENVELSEEGRKAIDAMCVRIAGRGIDREARREIRGRLEAKALAYLGGKERIGEADALALVERHFGEMDVLQYRLQEVHADGGLAGARGMLAAAVIVGFSIIASHIICAMVWKWSESRTAILYVPFALMLMQPVSLWAARKYWRNELAGAGTGWFARWSIGRLIAAVLITILGAQNMMMFAAFLRPGSANGIMWNHTVAMVAGIWGTIVSLGALTGWMAWCGWPGRGMRGVIAGAGGWTVYRMVPLVWATVWWAGWENRPGFLGQMGWAAGIHLLETAATVALGLGVHVAVMKWRGRVEIA